MRKLHVLMLSTSLLAFTAGAAAQEQPAPPSASASAAPAPAPPPPATTAAPPATTPAPTPSSGGALVKREDDQEPLRLGRLIETEADRAHSRRIGGSVVGMVTGAGVIASGAILWAIGVPPGFDATPVDILAVMSMVLGGVQVASSLISLFITEPMERLFDAYAPIAIDKTLSPSERVRRGEVLLGAMAETQRSRRVTEATTSLVLAAIEAGFAVFVAADNQFVLASDPSTNSLLRGAFAVAFGLGAATAVGQAVGSLLWERGPAEIAWEHWQASHGTVTVHTESKLHLRPVFTPVLGGGVGGLSLRF